MNLQHLTNNILRMDSKRAASQENRATTLLLHHIKEVDRRRLYSDWKFTSLFDWCVKDLGLCEGSAHLRITAARLLADMPELEEKIDQGILSLSHISQVNQFCRENKIKDLEKKKNILGQIENLTKKETDKKLFGISGVEKPGRETKKRISDKKTKVSYILSDETLEALDEVKKLLGKQISSDELMKLMIASLKEKVEKEKFKQTSNPKRSKGTKVTGRIISAEVKRKVYLRDKKCVSCGSQHRLNFDHAKPYALGGTNTIENIRLLCFHCNQRASMKMGLGRKVTSSG